MGCPKWGDNFDGSQKYDVESQYNAGSKKKMVDGGDAVLEVQKNGGSKKKGWKKKIRSWNLKRMLEVK